jgi:hypothetical protein
MIPRAEFFFNYSASKMMKKLKTTRIAMVHKTTAYPEAMQCSLLRNREKHGENKNSTQGRASRGSGPGTQSLAGVQKEYRARLERVFSAKNRGEYQVADSRSEQRGVTSADTGCSA